MQFIYDAKSGDDKIEIEDELYKYLIKVRRHKIGEILKFRNLKDKNLYSYEIVEINKKNLLLQFKTYEEKIVENHKNIHLAWCIVDTKTIEKNLPYLNELGVYKISFIYSDYSQKNFKLNYEKYEKILINSSQQCGRSSIIKFEEFQCIDEFLKEYPDSHIFNFSKIFFDDKIEEIKTIIVGCEGGFSERELKCFESSKIVGINTNLILKSETAITCVASKLLV